MEGGRADDAVRWMEKAAESYQSTGEVDQARQARNRMASGRERVVSFTDAKVASGSRL
jgi:hypothetical protein